MARKFRNNDRVVLVDNTFGDREKTPVWGGKFGYMVGTIKGFGTADGDDYAKVYWDHGTKRALKLSRLRHYSLGLLLRSKAKVAFTDTKRAFRPYKKYVWLAVFMLVADHILLKGKITARLKSLAESLADRATAASDKLINKINI